MTLKNRLAMILMTSLVKPDNNLFDIRRFWEHSVGCAIIADRLYREKLVDFRTKVEFNDYWIGALLHDAGKLVLGFFFWDHFQGEVLPGHLGKGVALLTGTVLNPMQKNQRHTHGFYLGT